MKIYAVADVHGRLSRLEKIRATVDKTKSDVVVIAGDITNLPLVLSTEYSKNFMQGPKEWIH